MPRSVRNPGWMILLAASCMLSAGNAAPAAEKHRLESSRRPGDLTAVRVELEVGGELKVVADGKVKPLKMNVMGKLAYEEKLLGVLADKSAGMRYARHYDQAEAKINIENGEILPRLRDERRLIVVDAAAVQTLLFSPQGPLTREELDLLDVPGNSVWLEELLPAKPVAIGDQWRHSDQLLASLLGLDAVSQSDVTSELKAIDAENARFELSGEVHGAIGGVATEISLKAKYRFDRKRRRVAWAGLLVKEKRSVGHVATGLDVVAKMQIALSPRAEPKHLPASLLKRISLDSPAQPTTLECQSPTGKFRFQHSRGWHVMNDASEVLTMRYVDRGELVAQCNVSAPPDAEPGKSPTLASFQREIQTGLDKSFGQFIQASESVTSAGHVVYRVVAEGKVSELPIQWRYYLVADDQGRQAIYAFTLESELAAQLGDADQELVSTLEFVKRPGGSGRPTPVDAATPKVSKKVQAKRR
ncbi:MAG TPA: hypothetical protein VMV10_27450 [Pirellulales bacterium]|nr:hypothetical protein [Pirellulales bacterium]